MAIVDTAVHDFDVTRWLLGEELTAIRVIAAKPNSHGGDLQDPLLMILETDLGRAGRRGDLGQHPVRLRHPRRGGGGGRNGRPRRHRCRRSLRSGNSVGVAVPQDWRERFIAAYDVELQEWINEVAAGSRADRDRARGTATRHKRCATPA